MKKKRIKQLNITSFILIAVWFGFGIYADLHRDTILGSLESTAEEKVVEYAQLYNLFMISTAIVFVALIILTLVRTVLKRSNKVA